MVHPNSDTKSHDEGVSTNLSIVSTHFAVSACVCVVIVVRYFLVPHLRELSDIALGAPSHCYILTCSSILRIDLSIWMLEEAFVHPV